MYSVLIRPLKQEDAFVSYNWRNDPSIWEFTGKKPDKYITPEIEIEWINSALKENDSFRFAIVVDGKYIGNIQVTNIKNKQEGEYHIFIGEKAFWGKGIATLATFQLLRFAKESIGLKRLFLKVNKDNKAAIRVYEKCGFEKNNDGETMGITLSKLSKPMVSVFMITFNHEPYIRQAIESVLAQKTNFDFDIVIGEDCSTDNTRKVIKEISEEFPGKFKLLLHKENIGPMANQIAVLHSCTGKYIAMCEGDDYWVDPLKLQKQIDFLEANPEFMFSFHDAMFFNQKTNEKRLRIGDKKIDDIVDLKSLIRDKNISTASLVFRNILDYSHLPGWFEKIQNSDYGLCVLLAERGLGKYIPDVMSVYRIHEKGIWSGEGTDHFYKSNVKLYRYLLTYFTDSETKKTIKAKIGFSKFNYGIIKIREGRLIYGLLLVFTNFRFRSDKRIKNNFRKIASAIKSGIKLKAGEFKLKREF